MSPICGGFFDVPKLQARIGELDALMAGQDFWGNQERAQTVIEEASSETHGLDLVATAAEGRCRGTSASSRTTK